MKYERPCSSESWTRMLVSRSAAGIDRSVAHTGAPACASTALRPMARSSVLFPDMFDPVISSSVPGGPTTTSLATRRSSGISGWPRDAARSSIAAPSSTACTSGKHHAGIVLPDLRERAERVELADRLHPAAHAMPDVAAPRIQREEHVEVPERQRLEEEVEDRRPGAELRKAQDAHQAAHARRRGCPAGAQPRLDVREQRPSRAARP